MIWSRFLYRLDKDNCVWRNADWPASWHISTKSYRWQWKSGCSLTSCPGRNTSVTFITFTTVIFLWIRSFVMHTYTMRSGETITTKLARRFEVPATQSATEQNESTKARYSQTMHGSIWVSRKQTAVAGSEMITSDVRSNELDSRHLDARRLQVEVTGGRGACPDLGVKETEQVGQSNSVIISSSWVNQACGNIIGAIPAPRMHNCKHVSIAVSRTSHCVTSRNIHLRHSTGVSRSALYACTPRRTRGRRRRTGSIWSGGCGSNDRRDRRSTSDLNRPWTYYINRSNVVCRCWAPARRDRMHLQGNLYSVWVYLGSARATLRPPREREREREKEMW